MRSVNPSAQPEVQRLPDYLKEIRGKRKFSRSMNRRVERLPKNIYICSL